jgi:hypothetical protein
MEARIINIRTNFSNELAEYHKSLGPIQIPLNTPSTSIVLKESTSKEKEQTPLMMKKINRYKAELSKNNLKKAQKPFTFQGDIDSYLAELTGSKP